MEISKFVSQLGPSGLAKANRYSVVLDAPPTVRTSFKLDLPKILLFCDSVNLPGLNVNTTPIRTFGEVREIPYEFNYDAITMTFYVDGAMEVKAFFDAWIKSIQQGKRRTFNYYDQYICPQMQIKVEDLANKERYIVELYEVFPKTVSPIQMGYDQKDVMKLQVTFMFKWWSGTIKIQKDIPEPKGTGTSTVGEREATRYLPSGWQLAEQGEFGTDFNVNRTGFYNIQQRFNDIFSEIGGGSAITGRTEIQQSFGRFVDFEST
jgi:hypothetical protein